MTCYVLIVVIAIDKQDLTHILEVVRVLAEGEGECVESMLVVFLSTKQKHQQM